jgi:hypothetical protein
MLPLEVRDTDMQVRIKNGKVRFVYNDALSGLMQMGASKVARASHVEPNVDGKWEADLSPVGGPVLGPYDKRKTALDAEVAWLRSNNIPVPKGV